MSDRDLSGKVMLVTGANTGIGRATAEALARRDARLILACRSKDKTEPVLQGIRAGGARADWVALDLGDLKSVRACAEEVLSADEPLHVLVNNAGLAGLRGKTKQGFEVAFGTNHLGHFLLTELLLPRLRESSTPGAPARIVNVSSKAHYDASGIDWDALQRSTASITGLREYAVSKLCNVLFTRSLARGKAGFGIRNYSLHPGVVASDAWRHAPWPLRPLLKRGLLTNEEGAKTTLYCATSPEVVERNGLYYDDCKEKEPSPLAHDVALADDLWARSEAWCIGGFTAAR
jgi:NAD(P)-dependent dehydrogenase (short-subunit alcohol dehydrogenase family)